MPNRLPDGTLVCSCPAMRPLPAALQPIVNTFSLLPSKSRK